MKINSITPTKLYSSPRTKMCSSAERGERAYERHNLKQINNDQINTTSETISSAGRVSFKGGVPLLHRAANFASDNPLVAEALFAILITCGARPLTIMATAKTDEDKEKCSYQAAKSISSGLVGLGTTALIGAPIAAATKLANKNGAFNMTPEMKEKSKEIVKKGVDALSEFGQKLAADGSDSVLANQIKNLTEGGVFNLSVLKKAGKGAEKTFIQTIKEKAPDISETVAKGLTEQRILNNYAKTGKNVMDKLFQPVFMPLRATITVALVPILLGLVGKHKPASKPAPVEQKPVMQEYEILKSDKAKELFGSFEGVLNHEN